MTARRPCERGFAKSPALALIVSAAVIVALYFFGGAILQFARESFMRRTTFAHYEILCPPWALSQKSATEFASEREILFLRLNRKIGNAASSARIRIIFNPDFSNQQSSRTDARPYSVTGTTIRARLDGRIPVLPAAADAEAILDGAWGKPGNAQITRWIAMWLAGQSNGTDLGMAAAQVEQRLGHKKIESLLSDPGGEIASTRDRDTLGAAWIAEIAEFGGTDDVRKLYSAVMPHPNIAEVTATLGTTPLELDRKWQLWIYSYLAGMPSMPSDSAMPMDMPMPAGNQ